MEMDSKPPTAALCLESASFKRLKRLESGALLSAGRLLPELELSRCCTDDFPD